VAVAAGNEYGENGQGSIGSPGTAADAITVGASSSGSDGTVDQLAVFSSSGPTVFGLLAKPDVTAPGVDITSSIPGGSGWDSYSGTSMATPHVAGAAALLRQRHPGWSVAEIKSALVSTAAPVHDGYGREVSPLREGGGRIALVAADNPLLFTVPSSVSFGFVRQGRHVRRDVRLLDVGLGAGTCAASLNLMDKTAGAAIDLPATVDVPGTLSLEASASASAHPGDVDGFVVLDCSGQTRRIPFWGRVSAPQLQLDSFTTLLGPGTYSGDTKKLNARVTRYLYPARAPDVFTKLAGPEQVFRFYLKKRSLQNLGVIITSRATGVGVTPRIVRGTSENRLAGLTALPVVANPYLDSYGKLEPVSAVLRAGPGLYSIVFDSRSRATAGRFSFRFWVNDVKPPTMSLLSRKNGLVRIRVTDNGSGVDPDTLAATVDERDADVSFNRSTGVVTIDLRGRAPGKHSVVLSVSDYQETKNDENANGLLRNTSTIHVSAVAPG
jgi:hypothetical protein